MGALFIYAIIIGLYLAMGLAMLIIVSRLAKQFPQSSRILRIAGFGFTFSILVLIVFLILLFSGPNRTYSLAFCLLFLVALGVGMPSGIVVSIFYIRTLFQRERK